MSINAPVLASKFEVVQDTLTKDLPRSTESWLQIYQHVGYGAFYGIMARFNNDDIEAKLVIDGRVVYEIDLEELDNYTSGGDDDNIGGVISYLSFDNNKFRFMPPYGIEYKENIQLYFRSNDTSNKRDIYSSFIYIDKQGE